MNTRTPDEIETPVLLARIEELQVELAAIKAAVAGRLSTGEAIRRATAFDDLDEPQRRRPVCRPRTNAAADASGASNEAPETNPGSSAATPRGNDQHGRDITTLDAETALRAVSADGRGAVFAGARAALRLLPSDTVGPAPDGRPGDLHVDGDDALWYFGRDGWVRLA